MLEEEFLNLIGPADKQWNNLNEKAILAWNVKTEHHQIVLQVFKLTSDSYAAGDPESPPFDVIYHGLLQAKNEAGYSYANILCTNMEIMTFIWVLMKIWDGSTPFRCYTRDLDRKEFEAHVIKDFAGRIRRKVSTKNPSSRHAFSNKDISEVIFLN